jgi:hypothetical protein
MGKVQNICRIKKIKTISTRFASDSNPHDHGKLGQLRMKVRTTANWKTYTKQRKIQNTLEKHKET